MRIITVFIAVAIISVFTNVLMLTGPLFMLQVYDRVLASRSEETLVALFALVAFLYLLYAFLEYARSRAIARVGASTHSALGAPVLRALLQRAALKTKPTPGTIQDLDAVRNFMGSPVLLALFDLPWTPLFIAAIFIFHPLLGWLAVAGGGLLVVVALANQMLTAGKTARGNSLTGAAQQFARRVQEQGEYVWAQGMQHAVLARFARAQDEAIGQSMAANDWTGSFSSFSKAFRLFLQSAMLALGGWLVLQQELSPGAMIAGSILMGRALAPIDMVIGQWAMVQRARRGHKDIKALLAASPEPETLTELPSPEARMALHGVTVIHRPGDPPTLEQVSIEARPGQVIGVIGRSGSGKSTVARVMAGLITPLQGEVRLAGAALAHYGSERLGRHIGYLPQEIQFFEASIAENIAQLDLEPDSAQIVAAAQKARVHDIILSLPDGYETVIGPDTTQLSGGQKQRLALARALYRDPVILILDEPNSALDAEGSEALNQTVSAMKAEGKSVFIMTHRPAAIQSCDTLVILEKGKVSANGPRDEIIRSMMANADRVKKSLKAGGANG